MPVRWFHDTSKTRRHLVAVSGGADSVALLHFLIETGFSNLVVCHLDHGLRGKHSKGDAKFVASLAKAHGLVCEIGHENVASLAKGKSLSLETAGREARHRFFAHCARLHRCPRILLAHHADDQAETMLWNLLRGSHGAKAMREIQPIVAEEKKLELIRPLLGLRRHDLREFLVSRGLSWREDASNAENFTARNRLRNEALPLLADISGRDIVPSLCRAIDSGEDHEAISRWALEQAKVLDPQGRLHLPALKSLPAALQRAAIANYLGDHGIRDLSRELLEKSLDLLDVKNPACLNLPGGRHLRRRAARLTVE
jgi:tRNA(Ile)-lysidine synthase